MGRKHWALWRLFTVVAVALASVLNALSVSASTPAQDLAASLNYMARSVGGTVGITLIDLSGPSPTSYSWNANHSFTAASTYKLPVLMYEARGIAWGQLHNNDVLCYISSDYEPGYFGDYWPGRCFTRYTLAYRVGHYSDNTAAHILVRYMGGSYALNNFARAYGAYYSQFFYPNVTVPSDLARLWRSEGYAWVGGTKAQAWLFPILTHTLYESGIPAGLPYWVPVAHKIGIIGYYVHDAALVRAGRGGWYVLVVMTYGLGQSRAWSFMSHVSARVWQYENSR